MFHVVFYEPQIPPNTGNAIRMSANIGGWLHLVEPLGFDLSDAKLRRAGLDYHDLTHVRVHPNFDALREFLTEHGSGNIYAFTGHAERRFTDVRYQPGDALLFGREPDGLPDSVLNDPRLTDRVRIPMAPNNRSLNLSNSAAVAAFEAWRQNDFAGGA